VIDIQTISIAIASASVVAGVVYYALQLRHQNRMRQTDLVTRLYSVFATEEFQKEMFTLMTDMEIKDYNTFRKKYAVNVPPTGLFFEEVGVLLGRKLADIGLISNLFGPLAMGLWEKMKPIAEDARRQLNSPGFGGGFEYLYNELQKREQQLAKTK
jgi:hypothetical protein